MNYRPLRVGKLIREELSLLIQRELEFGPGVLVTVTEVEIKKKLETAGVRVSVLPSEKAAEALRTLMLARNNLQFQLGRKLNIRPMPNILFSLDRGPENAAAVEKALMDQ